MTIQSHPPIATRIPQRLQRLARSGLRQRIAALRLRLARYRLRSHGQHQSAAGRFSAIERVMRRTVVHSHRAFTAHMRLQALLAGGIVGHTQRVEVRQFRGRQVPGHTLRQHDRTLVMERVLHQRLLDRLTRTEAAAAAPRLSFAHRVEQRQGAPRIPLTMVTVQPPVAQASPTAAQATVAAPSSARTGPSQPRFAPAVPPVVLPPQELSRVTDHVIRQLDHRVLSWQERTGRV
jgi:hypothetical protein